MQLSRSWEVKELPKSCGHLSFPSTTQYHNPHLLALKEAANSTLLGSRCIVAHILNMAGLFGSAASTSQANTLGDLSKDVALQTPPEDSISDLAFSPLSDHLAVASWDKKVRIYQITQNGGSEGKAFFEHDAPVLSCHWSPVSPSSSTASESLLTIFRMVRKSSELEQTNKQR